MSNTKRRFLGGVIALVGLTLTVGVASWGQNKAPTSGGLMLIGNFSISYGTARIKGERKKSSDGLLELAGGLNGAASTEIRTTEYDLAAPKITVNIKNRVMDAATASGGVRVVTRERSGTTGKLRQAINLRSDTANYVSERKTPAGAISRPARLELRGNVKGTYLSSLFSETDPLKIDTDAVDIEFPDAETAEVVLRNGTITGTPVEQPKTPKPAGKNP